MWSTSMLQLVVACLVHSSEGAVSSFSVSSLLLRNQGPSNVDTKALVASLGDIAHGLQAEDGKALDLAGKVQTHCSEVDKEFTLSLARGKRNFDMATAEYEKASADVASVQASLAELKAHIAKSHQELDGLQAELKKARVDSGQLKRSASSSLEQMHVAIAKTYLKEGKARHGASLFSEQRAATLERLSEALSFVQTHAQHPDAEAPHDTKPLLVLKEDMAAVVKASDATQRGITEQEKKLLGLIKVEQEKLRDLEAILADLQPALTNKLMQSMEINRTLAATSRGMKRDVDLKQVKMSMCELVLRHLDAHRAQRSHVTSDVLMASKLLESMDTSLFLSRDLVGLKQSAATSLLQLTHRHWREHADESVSAFVQDEEGGAVSESLDTEGPFDKVTVIISGLIASLKSQANEDVSQNQFCLDGLSQSRRARLVKKNGIDTLSATIRWSKMAIVRLDDDAKYLEEDMNRLATVQSDTSRELELEKQRTDAEFAAHKVADEIMTKGILVLSQLCGTSLLQQNGGHLKGSRFSQCKESSKLLGSASKGLEELDKIGRGYLDKYTTLSGSIGSNAASARDARDSELKSTKAARAQRASELATANEDIAAAQQEITLIDKTKIELEHQCSHVEKPEERMDRRADEVHALKEALNVLGGESIPV